MSVPNAESTPKKKNNPHRNSAMDESEGNIMNQRSRFARRVVINLDLVTDEKLRAKIDALAIDQELALKAEARAQAKAIRTLHHVDAGRLVDVLRGDDDDKARPAP